MEAIGQLICMTSKELEYFANDLVRNEKLVLLSIAGVSMLNIIYICYCVWQLRRETQQQKSIELMKLIYPILTLALSLWLLYGYNAQ